MIVVLAVSFPALLTAVHIYCPVCDNMTLWRVRELVKVVAKLPVRLEVGRVTPLVVLHVMLTFTAEVTLHSSVTSLPITASTSSVIRVMVGGTTAGEEKEERGE